ncbi:pirin family protein [Dyadobacter sp. CY312]|uniref:pirin family protein n=1 Tax=Dyadobacter sp. CY312 TaxID=2907303 RepID=UPI001F34AEE9|nr:pirin family protein [Dyadobacter sp. CY312]MCE7039026.1 pirin family protein [Dyadobacter sp. CY312]
MENINRKKRKVSALWSVEYHKNTPIHKAGLLLAPGNWERFDPFLLMAEDHMKQGAFDYHPHRGIETVSYMIDGELKHMDNKGGRGVLWKGDVQWMTAGKGILHHEEAPENGFAHLLQLWVNLPAESKMVEPRYQDILESKMVKQEAEGVTVKVISGSSGELTAETRNYVPVTMVEISLKPGSQFSQDLPPDYNGFIFVLEGSGEFGSDLTAGKEKQVLWLSEEPDEESEINIHALNEPLKVLVIAGKRLRESVAAKGPFVMNTEEEIKQAYKDFREGKFGAWSEE